MVILEVSLNIFQGQSSPPLFKISLVILLNLMEYYGISKFVKKFELFFQALFNNVKESRKLG